MTKLSERHNGWEILDRGFRWEARKLGARGMIRYASTREHLVKMIDDQEMGA